MGYFNLNMWYSDKKQEMFSLCINYLHGIESALFLSNRMFEAQRNSIAYKERSEQT